MKLLRTIALFLHVAKHTSEGVKPVKYNPLLFVFVLITGVCFGVSAFFRTIYDAFKETYSI